MKFPSRVTPFHLLCEYVIFQHTCFVFQIILVLQISYQVMNSLGDQSALNEKIHHLKFMLRHEFGAGSGWSLVLLCVYHYFFSSCRCSLTNSNAKENPEYAEFSIVLEIQPNIIQHSKLCLHYLIMKTITHFRVEISISTYKLKI